MTNNPWKDAYAGQAPYAGEHEGYAGDQQYDQYYQDSDVGGGYGPYDYNQDGYEDYPVAAYPADVYDTQHGMAAGQQPVQYYNDGGQRGMPLIVQVAKS
jgi:hypothetical protein